MTSHGNGKRPTVTYTLIYYTYSPGFSSEFSLGLFFLYPSFPRVNPSIVLKSITISVSLLYWWARSVKCCCFSTVFSLSALHSGPPDVSRAEVLFFRSE